MKRRKMLAPEPNMINEYLERRSANRLGTIPYFEIPYGEGSRDPEPGRTVGILGFIQGAQDGYNYNKKGEYKMRDVKIRPVINGWIVNVGCKDVVFDNMEKMLQELKYYILDPTKVEASYMRNAVNRLLGPPEIEIEVTHPTPPEAVKGLEGEESAGYGVRADDSKKTDVERPA